MTTQVINEVYNESFANVLKNWLRDRDLTLRKAAVVLETDASTLSRILHRKKNLKPGTIDRLLTRMRGYNAEKDAIIKENEKNIIKEVIK